MTTQDIAKLAEMLNTLREVTGNHTAFTKKGVESYYKALQKFSISDIEKAIDEATETMRRMPSPADLKGLIAGQQGRNNYKPYVSDDREVSMPAHVYVLYVATIHFWKLKRLQKKEVTDGLFERCLKVAKEVYDELPEERKEAMGRTRGWYERTGRWKDMPSLDVRDEDPFEVAR
jgi:hypothetical protein